MNCSVCNEFDVKEAHDGMYEFDFNKDGKLAHYTCLNRSKDYFGMTNSKISQMADIDHWHCTDCMKDEDKCQQACFFCKLDKKSGYGGFLDFQKGNSGKIKPMRSCISMGIIKKI